jgi:integrase
MLTEVAIRKLKPSDKPRKVFDGGGLYLLVGLTGSLGWRLKYRVSGKEKLISFGTYPTVSLKEARQKRDEARVQLAKGIDPSLHRRAKGGAKDDTFEAIAREWYGKFSQTWVEAHGDRILRRFERDIFPWLGGKPIAGITAPQLLACLRRIESRGAVETAHRALQNCGQVFRYAVATGRAERDPSRDLRGSLPPVKERHHASITDPKRIGALLRAIDGYEGSLITKSALQLAPLVFVRPVELRTAEWSEIDVGAAEWRIPAAKMKMREKHVIPLSKQAITILETLKPFTSTRSMFVFPSTRTGERPMSENTVLAGLRRLGYGTDDMTGHGFRSMASTLLNEQGWHRDAIERQLAHAERDNIRAAYNYAEHLPERRRMMQSWADYLDSLRAGETNIVPIKRAKKSGASRR